MSEIKSYIDLTVWQKSMDLVELIYKLVKKLPKEERFDLASQLRRSVVSIPSNIAEGHERRSTKEYVRFLAIASGSTAELTTQLHVCKRLKYVDDISQELQLCDEVGKMIASMLTKLDK